MTILLSTPTILVPSEVVTVSIRTNIAFNFGANALAYMIWNADGTRDDKDNSNSAVQVLSSTDWIIPNSAASSSYRIRHSSESGDTGSFFSYGSINTWYAISGSRTYYVVDTTPGPGSKSCNFTIEIDKGSGTALDTGLCTCTADREDF